MKKASNSGKKSEPTAKRTKSGSTAHRETKDVLAELVGRLRKKLNQEVTAGSSAEVHRGDELRPNLFRAGRFVHFLKIPSFRRSPL